MAKNIAKPLGIAAAVAALLIAAAALFTPGLVRSQAQDWVATNLPGKALALGEASFNPFTLTLTLNDIAIADAAAPGAPLVAISQLILNASAASLFSFSPRFDAITVTQPSVNAILRPDASLNLFELIPIDDGTPTPKVRITTLTLDGGAVRFTDQRSETPLTNNLTPITFTLNDFSTEDSDSPGAFKLAGQSQAGEAFTFAGSLAAAPFASKGALTLTDLSLETLARLGGDALLITSATGRLSLAGDYSFATTTDPDAPYAVAAELISLTLADVAVIADSGSLSLASARLGDTRLSLADDSVTIGPIALEALKASLPSGDVLTLDSLSLASSSITLSSNAASIGELSLSGLAVAGGTNPPVRLAALLLAPSQIDPASQTASLGALALTGLTAQPRLSRDYTPSLPGLWPRPKAAAITAAPDWTISLAGLSASGNDLTIIHPAARTRITGDLSLGALDSTLSEAIPLTTSLAIGATARPATLNASGSVTPASGSASLDISLARLDVAALMPMAPPLPVNVKRGLLSFNGKLSAKQSVPRFTGGLSLANIDVKQASTDDGPPPDLLSLASLSATGITATPSDISLKRLTLKTLNASAQLSPTGKLNLIALTEDAEATAEPAQGETPAPKAASASAMPIIHIDDLRITDSSVGFQDLNITPNFAVRIEALEGQITNLDSRPGRIASVDLKGHIVDRFSPVTITGTGNAFNYADATDVTAKFANIELPVFNPYSGRFAGYSIARGKLETTLHYRINNRALEADHTVVIDQLQWGEATDSKDKVSLPIRLATSLLKDRNGVITLDLPVAGTVDDPSFRIWPVVWKIVGNVMTKLITAPFAALGSLFGSGSAEQAQFIAFAPGDATLAPESAAALATLATGLADKPVLNLDLPAGPAIREDSEAMTAASLHSAAATLAKAESYDALNQDKRYSVLKKLYKAKRGDSPEFPDDIKEKPARITWMEAELAPAFVPSDLDLASLGQARANAVKAALLADGALDPARIFLTTANTVAIKDDKPTMELKIK